MRQCSNCVYYVYYQRRDGEFVDDIYECGFQSKYWTSNEPCQDYEIDHKAKCEYCTVRTASDIGDGTYCLERYPACLCGEVGSNG